MKVEDYQIDGINKFVNSKFVLNEYPMIDHINIIYNEEAFHNQLWIRVILNTYEINKDNLLEMGLNLKELIEKHIRPIIPFFQFNEDIKLDLVVVNPSNKAIFAHFDDQNI